MANINHLPSLIRRACCCTLAALALPTFAAIPVRWTVDTFRVKPLVYDCYHGETLDLAADMTAYGEPLNLAGKTAHLFWQTNGMAGVYWQTNATVRVSSAATNVLAAVFSGAFDTGANEVQGFIGVDGENYRAAFTLRFRPSPGFVPSALPLPREVIDCATVSFTHPEAAPFLQRGEIPATDLSPATNYANMVALAATNYTRTATNDLATTLRGEIAAHAPEKLEASTGYELSANDSGNRWGALLGDTWYPFVLMPELEGYLPTSWAEESSSEFAGTAAMANGAQYLSGMYQLRENETNHRWGAQSVVEAGVIEPFAYLSELPSTNGFITAETDPVWTANSNNFANVILATAERTTESKIAEAKTYQLGDYDVLLSDGQIYSLAPVADMTITLDLGNSPTNSADAILWVTNVAADVTFTFAPNTYNFIVKEGGLKATANKRSCFSFVRVNDTDVIVSKEEY